MTRIETLFRAVREHAAGKFPWIRSVKFAFCSLADRHHTQKWRQFVHTEHRVYTVCFAKAAEGELTDEEVLGMSAHELGHVIGKRLRYPEHAKPIVTKRTPKAVQDEADRIVREVLELNLKYNKRSLQELR